MSNEEIAYRHYLDCLHRNASKGTLFDAFIHSMGAGCVAHCSSKAGRERAAEEAARWERFYAHVEDFTGSFQWNGKAYDAFLGYQHDFGEKQQHDFLFLIDASAFCRSFDLFHEVRHASDLGRAENEIIAVIFRIFSTKNALVRAFQQENSERLLEKARQALAVVQGASVSQVRASVLKVLVAEFGPKDAWPDMLAAPFDESSRMLFGLKLQREADAQ